MFVASSSSFSPVTVLSSNAAPQVTISGSGLDVPSVRAVRFEPGVTCTLTSANATAGTVNGVTIAAVSGSNQTMISVTQSSAIPAGAYSVCIDYVANNVTGSFVNVGSALLLIGVCVCVCLFVRNP